MQLADALTLTQQLINTGEVHQDYQRTVDLATKYKILITGENIGSLLIQFVQREDAGLFAQRIRMTKAITPAIASSIRTPFNKVLRNDRIRYNLTVKNEAKKATIEHMAKVFYGSARKQNRGLRYWLNTRGQSLQFSDPNTWVVTEWDNPADDATPITPRPFEVPAAWAVNFKVVNDETKWLLVRQPITYMQINGTGGAGTGGTGVTNPQPGQQVAPATTVPGITVIPPRTITSPDQYGGTKASGFRYTLYDEDVTVVYERVDQKYLQASGYVLKPGESLVSINQDTYLVRSATPKVGYPPVFRIGYKRDEATDGRTFVNPWHDALCFFEKTIKAVSELDLTMALHVFPQKLQYVTKCVGDGKKKCNGGRVTGSGETCEACKGSGYKLHTTAQDAVILPMPETPDDMLDLDKLLVYKAPPIETVQFQNTYILQLEQQAHRAVFNSQVFVKSSGPAGTGTDAQGQINNTATGADMNMQSVYDTLEPFTEKDSELYREFIILFGILSGEKADDITVTYEYPADYKLKTADALLADRKVASDSGAPQFLLATIDDDLATITYAGDPVAMLEYRVQRAFFPFMGKSPDEVAALLSSQYVPKFTKVLYCNFGDIFTELKEENPEFYTMDTRKQNDLVENKVQEFIAKLAADEPAVDLTAFRSANPLNNSKVSATDNVNMDDNNPDAGANPGNQGADNNSPNTNAAA